MKDDTRLIARELRRVVNAWAFAQVVQAVAIMVLCGVFAWGAVELMRGISQVVR